MLSMGFSSYELDDNPSSKKTISKFPYRREMAFFRIKPGSLRTTYAKKETCSVSIFLLYCQFYSGLNFFTKIEVNKLVCDTMFKWHFHHFGCQHSRLNLNQKVAASCRRRNDRTTECRTHVCGAGDKPGKMVNVTVSWSSERSFRLRPTTTGDGS